MKSFAELEIIDGVVCLMMDKVTAGALMNLIGHTSYADKSPVARLYEEFGEDEEIRANYDYFIQCTGTYSFSPQAICYSDIWPEENE